MIYSWKIPKYSIKAQTAGEELERISSARGELTPESVLAESQREASVLHGCFEWDNDSAAEKYRIHQARTIIQNLTVTVVNDRETSVPVRAFVQIQAGYMPVCDVVLSADYSNEMLNNALRELESFKTKYSALAKLQAVFASIDDVLAS